MNFGVAHSYRSVAYWCVHGDPDNLESLKDDREKGNYHKATNEYIELLMGTIEKEPSELDYEFGRWTTARLAIYLEEKTGTKLSGEQVRRILKQKKEELIIKWQRKIKNKGNTVIAS